MYQGRPSIIGLKIIKFELFNILIDGALVIVVAHKMARTIKIM
jgi:hypothetical protein